MRQCFGCSELISIRTSPALLDLISVPLGIGGHMNVNGGITEHFSKNPSVGGRPDEDHGGRAQLCRP